MFSAISVPGLSAREHPVPPRGKIKYLGTEFARNSRSLWFPIFGRALVARHSDRVMAGLGFIRFNLGVGYLSIVGLGVLALPHIAVGARWVCKL